MKRILLTIITLILFVYYTSAQDIKQIVISMPENIIISLDNTAKEMLLDNPTDTAKLPLETPLYGGIKRLKMSTDFISLQTSDAGTTQIKLLPLINDSKIICVVKTVCGAVCDSQISFYTPKWIPISGNDLFPEKDINWFIKEDVDRNDQNFKNAIAALDMDPMKITLFPDNVSLNVEYDIKNYLSEEDYKLLEPFLKKEPKVLNWNKTSFR